MSKSKRTPGRMVRYLDVAIGIRNQRNRKRVTRVSQPSWVRTLEKQRAASVVSVSE